MASGSILLMLASIMDRNRVILAGASGLVGTSLLHALRGKSAQITQLVRQPALANSGQVFWDPYADLPIADASALATLDGTTAAIHLAGANIAGHRWTAGYKKVLWTSRVTSTRALASLLARLTPRPRVLVSASAVGIYGNRGDEILSEGSALGSDFLAELCRSWEQATEAATDAGIRVVHLRFGVVLSPAAGTLARMLPIFRLGLGGRLGSGRQWMSWIALPDVLAAIEFALETPSLSGPINLVAPEPVSNAEFAGALGHVLHRPALLPAPAPALKIAFGEMVNSTILASQRAIPERLRDSGFRFREPELGRALAAMLQAS
jgi:uncharacterized protein (TIGR01777 family)